MNETNEPNKQNVETKDSDQASSVQDGSDNTNSVAQNVKSSKNKIILFSILGCIAVFVLILISNSTKSSSSTSSSNSYNTESIVSSSQLNEYNSKKIAEDMIKKIGYYIDDNDDEMNFESMTIAARKIGYGKSINNIVNENKRYIGLVDDDMIVTFNYNTSDDKLYGVEVAQRNNTTSSRELFCQINILDDGTCTYYAFVKQNDDVIAQQELKDQEQLYEFINYMIDHNY